jgi:hypothetical protein
MVIVTLVVRAPAGTLRVAVPLLVLTVPPMLPRFAEADAFEPPSVPLPDASVFAVAPEPPHDRGPPAARRSMTRRAPRTENRLDMVARSHCSFGRTIVENRNRLLAGRDTVTGTYVDRLVLLEWLRGAEAPTLAGMKLPGAPS